MTVLKGNGGGPKDAPGTVRAGVHDDAPSQEPEPSGAGAVPAELSGSLHEYARTFGRRIKSGESGMLPVLAALILIVVVFQILTSKYLSPSNIVNILALASIYIMFGMAETFALLLSEIDLSISYVGFVGAMIMAELMTYPNNWPWWAAVIIGLGVCGAIGTIQGTIFTRLHIPSFVVTLAGYLGWYGFLIFVTDLDRSAVGGVVSIPSTNVVWGIVSKQMSPAAGWTALAAAVALFGAYTWLRDARRRSHGLSAPPRSITIVIIAGVAAVGVVLVWVCNLNRGVTVVQEGVPYFVPVVVVILVAWTVILGRTRFGRYVYAIGANPEAARRAGIKVAAIETAAFAMCGLTAGFAGILYASRQGSMTISVTGGSFLLLGIAAAVIGGTSLFGGRGKAAYSVVGGLVVTAIYFGLYLLGVSADATYMAVAIVLIAAASVDTLVRRRGAASSM